MTVATVRQQVAARREAEFEAYHRWERQQEYQEYQEVFRNETTNASERISAPIDSKFSYFLGTDGLMSDIGEPLKKVVVDGRNEAEILARVDPDWEMELERRDIEIQEYAQFENLARRGEGAVVTFWPIPDAVRNGTNKIDGYNRKRMKMFARIGVATGNGGVEIGSLSLDLSDYEGMQAMARAIGHELPDGESSEDIARRNMPVSGKSLDDLKNTLRSAYDNSLKTQRGGEWYAGRPPISVTDALSFIELQTDLVGQHMQAVLEIKKSVYNQDLELKDLQYNFAAALEARLRGEEVTSLSDAGDIARSKGEKFGGDCPTGVAAQAQELGIGNPNSLNCVTCPFCRKIVDAKRTKEGGIMCPDRSCKIEARGGKIIDHKKRNSSFGKAAANAAKVKYSGSKDVQSRVMQNSKNVKVTKEITFGDSRKKYIDAKTGNEIKL